MDKDYKYYNIKEEINNIYINKNKELNYKNNIEYKYKNNKYNIYKDADSFSDLMRLIQLARRIQQQQQTQTQTPNQTIQAVPQTSRQTTVAPSTPNQQQTPTQTSAQTQAQTQAQAQQQTPTQTPSLTSRTATTGWSPMSIAGTIYKFNRGVIGIDYEGEIHEIILDRTTRHHNDATAEIGTLTNCPVSDKYAGPFENGLEVSEQGTLIIQLEGDSMLVYLPKEMTTEQYNKLVSEVTPRSNFTVSFTHDGQIYDDNNVTASALLSFSQNLTASTRRVSR